MSLGRGGRGVFTWFYDPVFSTIKLSPSRPKHYLLLRDILFIYYYYHYLLLLPTKPETLNQVKTFNSYLNIQIQEVDYPISCTLVDRVDRGVKLFYLLLALALHLD
jgi:hypothetical protein